MNIEGRCTNFGGCTLADSKTAVPMVTGADAFCPECNAKLFPIRSTRGRGTPVKMVGAAIAVVLIAALAVILWSRGRTNPADTVVVASPSPPASVSPAPPAYTLRLCGSNTMGERLAPLLAKAFSTRENAPGSDNGSSNVRTVISAGGTSTAFTSLAARSCDVGMASRQITPAERSRLRPLGDMSSVASEHVIGLDGITIIVNRANPVSALSVNQLRQVFGGSTKNWSAVHGAGGPIHLYVPGANTGTVDAFKMLVDAAALSPDAKKLRSYEDVAAAVSRDRQGIGFVAMPYANRAKAIKVSSGSDAIAPDPLAVGRETYPLSRRLYLYTASQPANKSVGAFIAFAQSDEGQLLVDRSGFVGTTKRGRSHKQTPVRRGAPPGFVRLTQGTAQSDFIFNFKVGSDALDNKAFVDIGRLVAAMHLPANRNQQIVLAGFADSTGSHSKNLTLSEARAHAVQHELVSRGVKVKAALGFGDAMPIRDNSTALGREKNRRVEIYETFKASP